MADDSNRGLDGGDPPPFEDDEFGSFEPGPMVGTVVTETVWNETRVVLVLDAPTEEEDVDSALDVARLLWDDQAEWTERLDRAVADWAIVTIETIYTPIAPLSCDRVCIDFQWLL